MKNLLKSILMTTILCYLVLWEKKGVRRLARKKRNIKNHIPSRMNIIFFLIFLLFSLLILRLGDMQIVKGEEYREMVRRTEKTYIQYPVPRGEIYDANYEKVVYNIPEKAIIYTPPLNPQPKDYYQLAERLNRFLTMNEEDIAEVKEKDLEEVWLQANAENEELLTEEEYEKFSKKKLSAKEVLEIKKERLTEDHLHEVDKNLAAIYKKLKEGIALTPSIIKNENVTDEEYAQISEHLDFLPGVDVATDWKRGRNFGNTFWNILGKSTTSEEGIPKEKVDYYRARGYSLNDRVGKSYLEELYDEVLQGRKEVVLAETNRKGEVVNTELVVPGETGKDIVLTIDMDFQAKVEQILEEEILRARQQRGADSLRSAFVVAMEPKTGYILAMAGRYYNVETGEFEDFTPGTFTTAYEAGSAVKGATVLAGFQTGVRKIGEVVRDEPMYLPGMNHPISSWKVLGDVNDLRALEQSSNVYMWKTVIEIMGGRYVPYRSLGYDPEKINLVRYYFAQFGLGVPTGIGFSNETAGVKGTDHRSYYQIGIGQLDTYTPMQLAQYVSTIANGGYRMKPQLVKEIREHNPNGDGPGRLIQTMDPVVLNRVDMTDEMIERVQYGFWLVTHSGTGRTMANEPYEPAGKTGTAQTGDRKHYNLSFVGYAPYEDPQIAISVIVPNAVKTGYSSSINMDISKRVFRSFFGIEE